MKNVKTNKLTARDLVTTGIFSALYTVFVLVGGIFFAPNPALTFLMPLGSALLPGPIFLLLNAKVGKKGSISIVGILVGILMLVTGMHWSMGVAFIVLGIISDLIASLGKYKNLKLVTLGYVLLTLSTLPTYIMFFVDRDNYLKYMVKQGTDPAYFEKMIEVGKTWMLPLMIIGTIVCALISAYVGKKMLKKQFERAGIL